MNPAYDIVNTPEETRTKINFATVGRDDPAPVGKAANKRRSEAVLPYKYIRFSEN